MFPHIKDFGYSSNLSLSNNMSTTITLPEGFTYVGAALVSTCWVLVYQVAQVGRHRKRAGIAYPQLYAEKAEAQASKDAHLFNCAQRAHQNTLENLPVVYLTTLVAGIKYPIFAASACAIWSLSRIAYTRGYLTGDPKKRSSIVSTPGTLALLAQLAAATFTAGGWLYAGLSKHL